MTPGSLIIGGADGSIESSFEIKVHAVPGASRSEVAGRHGDSLKIRIAAAPEQGRANHAIIAVLATVFGVRASDVELVSGGRHRSKRFVVRGVILAEAQAALDRILAR